MSKTNKITLNGHALIDLTNDTATASDVAKGKTFHLANGEIGVGTATFNTTITPTTEEITVTPSEEVQEIVPKNANYLSKVIVEAIPSEYEIPTYFNAETDIEVV